MTCSSGTLWRSGLRSSQQTQFYNVACLSTVDQALLGRLEEQSDETKRLLQGALDAFFPRSGAEDLFLQNFK